MKRRAADLRGRAALVCANGWEPYESVWSTGEVAGVRAVLGEPGAIDEAVEAWAPVLWGVGAAEADARTDYTSTRKWFSVLAEQEEPTETEKARYSVARSASADLRAAVDSGDPDKKHAAFGQLMQTLSNMNPDETRDKLHAPDGAGPYRDAMDVLVRKAESRCEAMCGLCGEPGSKHAHSSGWLEMLCRACAQTEGYEPVADHRGLWKVTCYRRRRQHLGCEPRRDDRGRHPAPRRDSAGAAERAAHLAAPVGRRHGGRVRGDRGDRTHPMSTPVAVAGWDQRSRMCWFGVIGPSVCRDQQKETAVV